MLINRALEGGRSLRLRSRLLARRSRQVTNRVPIILVPSVLGVRLRGVWGRTRDLYRSGSPATADGRPAGLLHGFPIIPGLWSYDCYGGLVRFLERVGGFRRSEELHVLEYDWRTGIADAAEQLDALVDRIRGAGDERVDLVCVSTGGLVARLLLAMDQRQSPRVRRVVHVGTPQRGSLHVAEMLATGVRPAPLGRRFSGADVATMQTAWDCLPHPDERVFVDQQGNPLPHELHDPATWISLGMSALGADELGVRLQRARALHATLDAAPVHAESIVIGGRNLPTAVRARVVDGRVEFPPCDPRRDDPLTEILYAPGDGSVPAASLTGLPGVGEERVWPVSPSAHHLLPAHPHVHRLILEALVAPDVPVPRVRQHLSALRRAV